MLEKLCERRRILGRHAVEAICGVEGPEEEDRLSDLSGLFRLARVYANSPAAEKEERGEGDGTPA